MFEIWSFFGVWSLVFGVFPRHPPNTPQVTTAGEVGPLAHFDRKIVRMLDGLAIHVANIECAVRAGREKHGTKPVVGRGQKLAAFVRHARSEGRPDRRQLVAMNQIRRRIASEGVAAILSWQSVAAVDVDRASGTERARMRIGGGAIFTNRIQARGEVLIRTADKIGDHRLRHILHRLGQGKVGVAGDVAGQNHCVLDVDAIHAVETIASVVKRLSKLPTPPNCFDRERERIEARIRGDLDRSPFGMLRRRDLARTC